MVSKSVKVDWISFTAFTGSREGMDQNYYQVIGEKLVKEYGTPMERIFTELEWSHAGGQRPYAQSFSDGSGITVYYDHRHEWSLVQISGQGCDTLRQMGVMEDLVKETLQRITRIDFAVDVVCDVSVSEFIDAGYSNRIRSNAHMLSGQGETFYLGSRKSELMTRVYRYFKPHPRADRLRIEHELKQRKARFYAEMMLVEGIETVEAELARNRAFEHPVYGVAPISSELEPMKGKQRHNNTVGWLYLQVAPSIARLVREGVIEDLERFMMVEFMEEIQKKLS